MKNFIFFVWAFFIINVFFLSCKKSTLSGKDTAFAIKDTGEINKVLIIENGDTLSLEKKGLWVVEGSTPADVNSVRNLLNTFSTLWVSGSIPDFANDKIMSELRKQRRIEVYSGNKKIMGFFLGKLQGESGNLAVLDNSKRVFLVKVPSFNGDLRRVFTLERNYWLSKRILKLSRDELMEVSFSSKNKEYRVFKENGRFWVKCSVDSFMIDEQNVDFLLKGLNNLRFLKMLPDSIKNLDSLKLILRLTVKSLNGVTDIKGYKIIVNGKPDYDLFLCVVGGRVGIAKYYDFDGVMLDCDSFKNE